MSQFEKETAVAAAPVSVSPPLTDRSHGRSIHHFVTVLTDSWNIAGNPNGGYALASSLRAISSLVPDHPEPISVTTHYLRPSEAGREAAIEVEVVRRGRRNSTLRSVMTQDGRPRITSLVTASDLGQWPTTRQLDIAPYRLPDPDACVDRADLPQGVDLPILSRVDVRLDPATVKPGRSAQALVAGWIRFVDGTEPTALALPLFADAFPPSPLSLFGQVGWIPTVELTVQVRARPRPGWIGACFQARDIGGGMLVEDGLLWDSVGSLVAQSRQLALLATD
ncbi:MAG: thioesterase family protein [Acidimicrobiia bacterium]|nr:thioesterase family protein [Acidimicrobiia bacterium]